MIEKKKRGKIYSVRKWDSVEMWMENMYIVLALYLSRARARTPKHTHARAIKCYCYWKMKNHRALKRSICLACHHFCRLNFSNIRESNVTVAQKFVFILLPLFMYYFFLYILCMSDILPAKKKIIYAPYNVNKCVFFSFTEVTFVKWHFKM